MSDTAWEHAFEARAALNAIVTDPDHGVDALSNAQTMSNLLKDYLPDAPREKSILVAAAEAGLADTLREHVAQGMDPNTAIRLTASSFSSSTPFTPEACNWVTDELAVALGISQPRQPGSGPAPGDASGGSPAGVGAAGGVGGAGNEGMPTRIAPIPGAAGAAGAAGGPQQPQQANQAPGQGHPQGQAQGFAAPGQPSPQDQPTAQGYRPGYGPGAQPGGFGQPQGQGYPGQRPQPQPQPYQGQRFPGQPAQPYPGQQQPQPYPGQQGRGYPGQPGYVQPGQPGQPGTPAGWAPGGGYGPGGGFGGPSKPAGGRRALLIGGGIIVLIVVIIVAAVFLTKKPGKHHQAGGGGSPSASATTPSPSHSATPSGGTEPLSTIMNPAGFRPVGTDCTQAILFGLNASTITNRTFCSKTTTKNIEVWGFQFDNQADYKTGFTHINNFTGFHRTSVNTTCNPPVQGTDGLSPWHANANPKYAARPGQVLECFLDNGKPLLIWSMPTMNVFFIARDYGKGDEVTRIVDWWKTVNYG